MCCAGVLASVGGMTGMLREPLAVEQMDLLRVIFDPFDSSGEWPVWQYADLVLDSRGIDAADVWPHCRLPGIRRRCP